MSKIIIGFIGDSGVGKTFAAEFFEKKDFYKLSIDSKVKEFAKHLELGEESDTIRKIRERGYAVHKGYWLNLVLSSIPEDRDLIVFDDISVSEKSNEILQTYQIYRPNISTEKYDDIDIIENDGNLDKFTQELEKLYNVLLADSPLKSF